MRLFDPVIGAATVPAAVLAAWLPRRHWEAFDSLPIRRAAGFSATITILAGAIAGVGGFIQHSRRVADEVGAMSIQIAEKQVKRELPEDSNLNVAPVAVAAFAPITFLFFTPLGLGAMYLVASGFARAMSIVIDEPFGDPVLTGIDTIVHRSRERASQSRRRRARERAEGAEVPDRLYPADWARLTDADFVLVASRRKPDWDKGTFVMTSDKWYVVGEPFDMQLPDGLRTIYPLKEHTTRDVMRRGVQYELPPLRMRSGRAT